MINEATINRAVELIKEAAPGATVVVFGSFGRGNANEESDLDLIVVLEGAFSRRLESTRLRSVLRPLGIRIDLLVVGQATYAAWRRVPGALIDQPDQPGRAAPGVDFGIDLGRLKARTMRPARAVAPLGDRSDPASGDDRPQMRKRVRRPRPKRDV